jgi:hypothetical protein
MHHFLSFSDWLNGSMTCAESTGLKACNFFLRLPQQAAPANTPEVVIFESYALH